MSFWSLIRVRSFNEFLVLYMVVTFFISFDCVLLLYIYIVNAAASTSLNTKRLHDHTLNIYILYSFYSFLHFLHFIYLEDH